MVLVGEVPMERQRSHSGESRQDVIGIRSAEEATADLDHQGNDVTGKQINQPTGPINIS